MDIRVKAFEFTLFTEYLEVFMETIQKVSDEAYDKAMEAELKQSAERLEQ